MYIWNFSIIKGVLSLHKIIKVYITWTSHPSSRFYTEEIINDVSKDLCINVSTIKLVIKGKKSVKAKYPITSYDTTKEPTIGHYCKHFVKTHIGLWICEGERGNKIQNYVCIVIPSLLKRNICAYGGKAKMLTVVILGRYNYKWFLFASLNFSICIKVEKCNYLKSWYRNSP